MSATHIVQHYIRVMSRSHILLCIDPGRRLVIQMALDVVAAVDFGQRLVAIQLFEEGEVV